MRTLTNDDFYKSVSDAEWDQAEAIESEIGELLHEGLTENTAMGFVRTVISLRKAVPEATVEGVFEFAFNAGLNYLGDEGTLARLRGSKIADSVKARAVRGTKTPRPRPRVRGV